LKSFFFEATDLHAASGFFDVSVSTVISKFAAKAIPSCQFLARPTIGPTAADFLHAHVHSVAFADSGIQQQPDGTARCVGEPAAGSLDEIGPNIAEFRYTVMM
jgi:hypothetical protein